MERVTTVFTNIKTTAEDVWYDFEDWAYEHQRKAVIGLVSFLIFSCLLSASMVMAQTSVRRSEIDELVVPALISDKVKPMTYGKADNQIADTQAISVMFAKPQGPAYNQVMKLLEGEKGQELNRSFYYYPVIYDTVRLERQYKVDPNQITFVFFEKGKETNRFVFDKLENYQEELIPELNRLPMPDIGAEDEK